MKMSNIFFLLECKFRLFSFSVGVLRHYVLKCFHAEQMILTEKKIIHKNPCPPRVITNRFKDRIQDTPSPLAEIHNRKKEPSK